MGKNACDIFYLEIDGLDYVLQCRKSSYIRQQMQHVVLDAHWRLNKHHKGVWNCKTTYLGERGDQMCPKPGQCKIERTICKK